MHTYATAQLIGDRSHQCDATATAAIPGGGRAYVVLDGIGSTPAVRIWTRTAARRLARAAAHHADAETGLRVVYDRYAANPNRHDPWKTLPSAAAVVAVHLPGRPLSIAWCGDARAYVVMTRGPVRRLTDDHNLRRVLDGRGNRNVITSYLGSSYTDEEVRQECGHPAIETTTRAAENCRLLLATDGAYEPLEDSCARLGDFLAGTPGEAARGFVQGA
ncbi:MAG TPA: protein phosphatase 2C domain-containing protein, partial [Streptomyces sp.]|nr:protein phosphatase 2C domain-containing protein [Streptomyces sp.]